MNKQLSSELEIPWGPIGYIVYKRTYSRIKDDGSSEEFLETIDRVLNACKTQLGFNITREEYKIYRKYLSSLKASVAGRFLWQLGTKTVDNLGLSSLQNCAFVVIDKPIKPFTWMFDMLMLGCGVGFNIQREHVNKLPIVYDANVSITRMDTKDAGFIVPDSREGWISLVEKTLESFFIKGESFTYSTILVRGKGSPLGGFGGVASGSEEFCLGIEKICGIFKLRRGKKLRPIDCLDIVCCLAEIVVSGNVRRSSTISLGDYDDIEYLSAKNWGIGNIPSYRSMCNCSVICDDIEKLPNEFWAGYNGSGEPFGIVNMDLMRKVGRLVDGDKYPDPRAQGVNPCVTGDTLISTSDGIERIDSLLEKEFDVIGSDGFLHHVKPAFCTGIKQVFKITTISGHFVKLTDNHKVWTIENGDVEVRHIGTQHTLKIFTKDNKSITSKVDSIKPLGLELVYDITEPTTSHFLANGIVVHNCSEQTLENGETCVSGDTYIHTEDGCYKIKDLIGKTVKIFNGEQWSEVVPFLAKEIDQFLKISFSDGSILKTTSYHEFSVSTDNNSFSKLRADQLVPGMFMPHVKLPKCLTFEDLPDFSELSLDIDELRYLQIMYRRVGNGKVMILTDNKGIWDVSFQDESFQQHIISIEKCENLEESFCFSEPLRHMGMFGNVLTHQCCLSDIFLPRIESFDEFHDIVIFLYKVCKHSLTLKCHQKETEIVVHNNMRMGIGITGYLESNQEQKNWLSRMYPILRAYDFLYSEKHGFPYSIKLTTVKPSGTLSLLPGCTPGCHPALYPYYIRRVRISSNHPLLETCRKHGFPIEYRREFDGTIDHGTSIVSFPCKTPKHAKLAKDMSAIDELEVVKELQTNWSDNAVSCTIYYRLEELPKIKEWLIQNYKTSVKCVSFLLHNDHGFDQAPYEEISLEQYNDLISKTQPIVSIVGVDCIEDDSTLECSGGSCPIK